MKILHVSYRDSGGAGMCAYRICKAQREMGIDSQLLVLDKSINESFVHETGTLIDFIYKLISKLLRFFHLKITDFNKMLFLSHKYNACYTSPVSWIDISKHPLVLDADIIHLHWVNGFIDYSSFFKKIKKPIFWTLHDENLFCGVAHYSDSIVNGNGLEIKYLELKKNVISNLSNLSIVFLSNYFYQTFSQNPIIRLSSKYIVHNSVDYKLYQPYDKIECRNKYNLKVDDKVFVFVADDISDPRKGLSLLIRTIDRFKKSNYKILAVGGNSKGIVSKNLISTGRVYDPATLSRVYSCGDCFVMPSFKEGFAQTPLEAMACGIPIVVFPVSGTEELVTSINGIRCSGFSEENLYDGLISFFEQQYSSDIIRQDVIDRFSPENIANQYISLYNSEKNKWEIRKFQL